MNIQFVEVKWKNFLSTGNSWTTINLKKNRLTLITGENGAGKTTMLDAIVYALFNSPFRSINLPQLVNSVNEKDCEVEVLFQIGKAEYRVIRGISPKKFEIYKNGVQLEPLASAKDQQDMLESQILKMSKKAFCQVVILGSTNYTPFMRLAAADRRSIVEMLLDIDIFSAMSSIVKGKVSVIKEELSAIDNKLAVITERITGQQKYLDVLKQKQKTSVNDQLSQIKELETKNLKLSKQIDPIKIELQSLVKEMSNDDSLETTEKTLLSLKSQITKNKKDAEKEIVFYKDNDACPICKQDISASVKTKKLKAKEKKTEEYVVALQEIDDEISNITSAMKKQQDIKRKISKLEMDVKAYSTEYNINQTRINDLQKKMTQNFGEIVDVAKEEQKLKEYQREHDALKLDKDKFLNDQKNYVVLTSMLKDNGIKGKIINYYLPILNKTINKYLTDMNFFVQFELDKEFKESIKSRYRDEFSYESFSEGEKKKIDLALLFAWRHLAEVKNSLNTNLVIFDEVLDGSLDANATDAFLEILKTFGNNNNIFVISHKPKDVIVDKFQNTITFEKDGNFSRIS
jgi:DNA repair exonuclease SbcCD ATPase subunit